MAKQKRVLGALSGDFSHPAHKEMFQIVSDKVINLGYPAADQSLKSTLFRISHLAKNVLTINFDGYDTILVESPLLDPNAHKALFRTKKQIISLFSSPGIYKVLNNQLNPLFLPFLKEMIEQTDAFIAVSKMCRDYLIEKEVNKPIEVAYPFIDPQKYSTLKRNVYNPNSNYFVTAGFPAHYKGIDFAIKIFDKLVEKYKNLEIKIITKSLESKYLANIKNKSKIRTLNNLTTNDFCSTLGGAIACLHFGRFDTFPVVTLESMLAGVPTFVSDTTGTKELVSQVNYNYITKLDFEECIDKLEWFLHLDEKERIKQSLLFKRIAEPFNKEKRLINFRTKFSKIILKK